MNQYERFKALCEQRGVSPSAAMVAAGLSKALATKWKNNPESVPNARSLKALTDFFRVSADYFLAEKDEEISPLDTMPEITMIARAGRKMTPEQRAEILHYAQYVFPEAFKDD